MSFNLGHGKIVLHQKEDGAVQLRDNLSFLWCSCSRPAVEYVPGNISPYDFRCSACYKEKDQGEGAVKI